MGRRFFPEAEHLLGPLESRGAGVWRSRVLGRMVYLVSSATLPVDRESLPLLLIGEESPSKELAMARLIVADPALWRQYHPWLMSLHPEIWKEVRAMIRQKKKKYEIDIRPAVEELGLSTVIEQVGLKRFLDSVGARRLVDELGLDPILASLSPAELQELKHRLHGAETDREP